MLFEEEFVLGWIGRDAIDQEHDFVQIWSPDQINGNTLIDPRLYECVGDCFVFVAVCSRTSIRALLRDLQGAKCCRMVRGGSSSAVRCRVQ